MKKFGVIMAGGGGTRFWPLSRQHQPKQLLNLTGRDVMINEAIDRLCYTVDPESVFVVTTAALAGQMLEAAAGRVRGEHILVEPAARNTAACIGYAAMVICRKYGDGIMVVTPSDAYIQDTPAFSRTLAAAVEAAVTQDKLVTVGIRPTFPATGYGYIRCHMAEEGDAKQVLQFREKPDRETAEAYFATGEYLWNSGMFVWKAGTVLKHFARYLPDIYADLVRIGDAMNTENEQQVLKAVYPEIRKISVDYGIMERAAEEGRVLVVPGAFGWSDVGSWDMLPSLHETDENGNVAIGDALLLQSKNTLVCAGGKLVAALGVEDLVIVDTPDALLVCPKAYAQEVRQVVDALQNRGRTELL